MFLDYDELTEGKFGEHIQKAIKEAPIFMLVLSKEALVRCKNDNDWVRQEIQLAIVEGKHVIPVNLDNTFDGIPEGIPNDIKEEVGTHQHSDINFGQTLGVTVDFMIKNRIVPIIGVRSKSEHLDNDFNALTETLKNNDSRNRMTKHIIKICSIVTILFIIFLVGYFLLL